jgi:CheY-like chemotaxis protein
MKDELKKLELAFQYDVATDGREAVEKFKILLNQGYLFDFIFMDIFLLEMDGVEATKIIREIENQYNCHSNIVAVTLEGKQQIQEGLFDEYCKLNFKYFLVEKPIKNSEKFFSYISTHFAMNRPGTKLKKFR